VRFFVVKDVRGRTVKTYGVNQDITERKRAEESLRLFRTLIDHSSEAIEVLDPETGRILDANQRAWTDTGYTREEFLSLNIGEIDPYIDDFSDYRARLEHLRETGAADMESVHRRKDGTTFPVEINLAYVRLDRDYIVTVVRDITARRQAEAEYRTILRTARDGFWLVDAAGRFLDVNEAYCQLVGYSRDELLRMAIQDIEAEETPKETKARMKKIIAEGSDRFETRHRARDGRVVDVEISVNYMDVGEGRCFVFIRDITGRKQMEEERDRLQSQLLQAQKMEAVGRLAGGVAHDFNNLLMGIRGFAGFARDSAEAGSQAHKDLTEALALADRAATLTRQLLAFSRRQALAPIALDLNGLIQAQANMLTRLLGEDIELRFLPASDLGSVRADPGQIEQVIMNLAVNARDAMPEGGSLTIETANVDLGPQYARDHEEVAPGPYVLLAITDSGLGMDAATRAQLFEPFFTTKELGKGTGLGLSTVYGIVKQHGGHIWVYSEPGSGTTFKVYLPRVAMDAEEPAPKSDFVVGGDETILLVEDSDAVRDVGRRHLESLGYKVLCAAGPREAEEVAQKHKGQIDLLLTDVVMPERGGRELYEAMAAHRTGLKVLYMSGYTDDAIVHRGVLEKGVAFLQKPFERDDLADKVRQALEA
jgi:two-component system cell cycle sensor histidine kinase/response regulator CckA